MIILSHVVTSLVCMEDFSAGTFRHHFHQNHIKWTFKGTNLTFSLRFGKCNKSSLKSSHGFHFSHNLNWNYFPGGSGLKGALSSGCYFDLLLIQFLTNSTKQQRMRGRCFLDFRIFFSSKAQRKCPCFNFRARIYKYQY